MESYVDRKRLLVPGAAALYDILAPLSYTLIRFSLGVFLIPHGYVKLFQDDAVAASRNFVNFGWSVGHSGASQPVRVARIPSDRSLDSRARATQQPFRQERRRRGVSPALPPRVRPHQFHQRFQTDDKRQKIGQKGSSVRPGECQQCMSFEKSH